MNKNHRSPKLSVSDQETLSTIERQLSGENANTQLIIDADFVSFVGQFATSIPLPSTGFEQRLAKKLKEQALKNSTKPTKSLLMGTRTRRLVIGSLGLIILMMVAMLTIPSLRTLAQEFIELLTRTDSNTHVFSRQVMTDEEREDNRMITGSLDEIEEVAEFDIWQPRILPSSNELQEVIYFPGPKIVILNYYNSQIHMYTHPEESSIGFSIIQQRAEDYAALDEIGLVGADAVIKTVQIGEIEGYYYIGSWIASRITSDDLPPGSNYEFEAMWGSSRDFPSAYLIWIQDGLVMKMMIVPQQIIELTGVTTTTVVVGMSLKEAIIIAESLVK